MTITTSTTFPLNLAQQLIRDHLVAGEMVPGGEIALRIDQALLQDVLGTLVMLELEAMGLDRVLTKPSVQYIDHGLVQADHINADSHLFLKSACERFGVWYSGPGNGISHPVHMEHFGVPGQSLVGCDSHTTAAGSLGMLAIGAGGIEVAMAMIGEPLYITMPRIWGVRLEGELPDWVSAKDVILELLRRHGVSGAKNAIVEYYGPGLASLSAMDRHVLANMGTEMGATTSVFPSDEETRRFLRARGRGGEWQSLSADEGATYDIDETLDLSRLVPLIALPSSPGNVVPVSEVVGEPVYQSYIGSSGNPGYRDFAVVSAIVRGRRIAENVSLDINPSTRQILATLTKEGHLGPLIEAGARLHQAGCNGCIGMGQAPAVGRNSLRTVPRNFQGRSGTVEDRVFLCSPETAAASALHGVITDPRTLDMAYPRIQEPEHMAAHAAVFGEPLAPEESRQREIQKTENTPPLPTIGATPDTLEVPVIARFGDNISTDDIMPAGSRVLPYWSNIYTSARFILEAVDSGYVQRAEMSRETTGHAIVAGENYGQGSSRENAALGPRYLGLQLVLAKSFARIHWQNLICFGVLPLTFADPGDAELLINDEHIRIDNIRGQLAGSHRVIAHLVQANRSIEFNHELSERQQRIFGAGGVINWYRESGGRA